ncbi:replication-associated recombination protein A [Rhabdochromatium marinum]|uniref:replication-associated recombination protein A n=1 Tax=Rhabdochromatium marinum TaxID=48729 RepID=UPI001906C9CA|nr:replication-associated recombination protein A [Rhabdochromatium marinum]MBK1648145.1 recombination factor protein RarA [Rhabdochromatium marinum]
MRPQRFEDCLGQPQLLAPGRPLHQALASGHLHSMILWGPPGTGKTTLARLVASAAQAHFIQLSAVLAGVKDVREAVAEAQALRQGLVPQATLLFIDEVHRFNKAQQDAFLPHVEDGTLTFIGATTENPSFALNNALLSRARVYVLEAMAAEALETLIRRALTDTERGLGQLGLTIEPEACQQLARVADGDARRALSLLELAAQWLDAEETGATGASISTSVVEAVLDAGARRFDKGGDTFYDQISALHKSVRGSAPDAALYWLARMIDGGCDPLYLARRLVRIASEDIGNADPRALELALNAWESMQRLGSPEGELALAQATVYLACAPKSNAVYLAWKQAQADARAQGSLPVPAHLCNAPTELLKTLGKGADYRYAHDEPDAYAAGECYFPEPLASRHYYQPVARGLETRIGEKLARLAERDRAADVQARYNNLAMTSRKPGR